MLAKYFQKSKGRTENGELAILSEDSLLHCPSSLSWIHESHGLELLNRKKLLFYVTLRLG